MNGRRERKWFPFSLRESISDGLTIGVEITTSRGTGISESNYREIRKEN